MSASLDTESFISMNVAELLTPKKRRNRPRKPSWSFAGLTSEQWQTDSQRVRWAQTDPYYKDICTIMVNGRVDTHTVNQPGGHSEGFHLGYVRGYEAAVARLLSLSHGVVQQAKPLGEPDYPPEE